MQSIGLASSKRHVQALVLTMIVLAAVWEICSLIISGSDQTLILLGVGLAGCAILVHILNNWQSGVLFFLLWIVFEDMARKYVGNSMAVYFAKDFLVGAAYLSFYSARRRRLVETFKIPFLLPLAIFFWFAVIQVFNTWSPSPLYGALGIKLYFYYAPLMLLGYAMVKTPENLERLLVINLAAGIFVAGLGIVQSVLGVTFLTPDDIAPEFYSLSHTTRFSPVTHSASVVTTSVFVSSGRFSFYLILLWILTMGALGYLLLSRRRGAKYGFIGIGIVTVAVMITGTRTPFVFMVASALMMTAAFLWGAPWDWGQGHRLVKALWRAFIFGAVSLILMASIFPKALGDHWNFLAETLAPEGQGSDLQNRGWDYPVKNLELAFQHDRWVEGYGTGTAALGMQYVGRLLNQPIPDIAVESGYGNLIVEMGILGPILWLIWVSALLWSTWKVVNSLRQTVYFPIAFAIWWYCFVLLVLLVHFGLNAYENFVNNAFMWLLVGVLYKMPKLAQMDQPVPMARDARSVASARLAAGVRNSYD